MTSSNDSIIKVENLSKRYRIGLKQEVHDSVIGAAISWIKAPLKNYRNLKALNTYLDDVDDDSVLWALKDVSFTVKEGEVLGIIGRNGAGKSTLLKILSRITEPTRGRVVIDGRVASLLEVGTGFHPELTGRENVYMNGSILGMRKAEIDRKFDEIVDFSGLEKFIDTPIKRYSSGMTMRLAFSVAAHLEPEILIIDEVLAVGDASFQKKCLGKMQEVARGGRTVLFVSHQLDAVATLCSRAILMSHGQVEMDGDVQSVIDHYISGVFTTAATSLRERTDRYGAGCLRFTETWIEDEAGNRLSVARAGAPVKIVAAYEKVGEDLLGDLTVTFWLHSAKNVHVLEMSNKISGEEFNNSIPDKGRLECYLPRLPLNVGSYFYHVFLQSYGRIQDFVRQAGTFDVEADDFYGTGKLPEQKWLLIQEYQWRIQELT
ncbi:MAG: ABC transporter ATP-binding protein [Acidobacteriota bacterium]